SGRLLPGGSAHKAEVTSVAFSRDGKTVISGAADGSVWLWNLTPPRGRQALLGSRAAIKSVAMSADGETAWAGGQDGIVRCWAVSTGKLLTQFAVGVPVDALAISLDGRLAAGTADGRIRIWDVRTAAECATMHGHSQAVTSLAYSPDGKTLASGGR